MRRPQFPEAVGPPGMPCAVPCAVPCAGLVRVKYGPTVLLGVVRGLVHGVSGGLCTEWLLLAQAPMLTLPGVFACAGLVRRLVRMTFFGVEACAGLCGGLCGLFSIGFFMNRMQYIYAYRCIYLKALRAGPATVPGCM